ncbi:hypothetical protein, partial [Pseudoalteromonas sp. S409]|uniref:hypothetical protein n=1 Tax=Pseudoalteromonas sp. S409 TaxID=2066518 RepID=UPI001BB263D4
MLTLEAQLLFRGFERPFAQREQNEKTLAKLFNNFIRHFFKAQGTNKILPPRTLRRCALHR